MMDSNVWYLYSVIFCIIVVLHVSVATKPQHENLMMVTKRGLGDWIDSVSENYFEDVPDVPGVLGSKNQKATSVGKWMKEHIGERKAEFKDKDGFLEGDMVASPVLKLLMANKFAGSNGRMYKWHPGDDENGEPRVNIPYELDSSLGSAAKTAIQQAISDVKEFTCVRFVDKREDDKDYINFDEKDGCWSHLGRIGGKQKISIEDNCAYKATVLHQIMHTLGFLHEHTNPKRDDFIKINYDKIEDGYKHNFKSYDHKFITDAEPDYDLLSIMHPNKYFFNDEKRDVTIESKKSDVSTDLIGQRTGFTKADALKINEAYCKKPTTTVTTTTTTPTTTTTTSTTTPTTTTTTTKFVVFPQYDEVSTTTTTTVDPNEGEGGKKPEEDIDSTVQPPCDQPLCQQLQQLQQPCAEPQCQPQPQPPPQQLQQPCAEPQCKPQPQPQPQTCQNPPCQNSCQNYPCYPQDFQFSNTGYPQSCDCQTTSTSSSSIKSPEGDGEDGGGDSDGKRCKLCKCLSVKSFQTPRVWSNNHLCYRTKSDKDPGFQLLRSGFVPGKKCLLIDDSKEWDNIHLCFDKASPYNMTWSDKNQVNSDGKSRCLKFNEPQDWAWTNKFLCSTH